MEAKNGYRIKELKRYVVQVYEKDCGWYCGWLNVETMDDIEWATKVAQWVARDKKLKQVWVWDKEEDIVIEIK